MVIHRVRRRKRGAPVAAVRNRSWVAGHTSPMTDLVGLEHEVSCDELSAGCGAGTYRVLCGSVIVPMPLTAAPGQPCPACAVELTSFLDVVPSDPQDRRRPVVEWPSLRSLPIAPR